MVIPEFDQASVEEWCLDDGMPAITRHALLEPIGFAAIVAGLARDARILRVMKEPARSFPGRSRALIVLVTAPDAVSLFHSSRCGYRAQYYQEVETGERANEYAVQELMPSIDLILSNTSLPRVWLEASLLGQGTKVWIYQGLWFRYRQHVDRLVKVARWQRKLDSTIPNERKLAIWGSLHPPSENRLILKGAFSTHDGDSLGNHKPTRGAEIGLFGYT